MKKYLKVWAAYVILQNWMGVIFQNPVTNWQCLAKSLVGQLKGTKGGSVNMKKLSKYFYDFFRMLTTSSFYIVIPQLANIEYCKALLRWQRYWEGNKRFAIDFLAVYWYWAAKVNVLLRFEHGTNDVIKNVYIAETSLRTISKLIHTIDVDILSKCMTSNAQKCLLSYCSNAEKYAKYAIRILAVVQKPTVGHTSNGNNENDENRKANLSSGRQ